MGRNKSRPSDYHPLLQFYLRKKTEGGSVLIPGDIRGAADEIARRECLVLVHGFNNTDSEAAEAYFGFRNRQQEIFSPSDRKSTRLNSSHVSISYAVFCL